MAKLTVVRAAPDGSLTVREAAERLRAHENTVRAWLRSGKIHGVKPGGDKLGYRIAMAEIDRIMGEQKTA